METRRLRGNLIKVFKIFKGFDDLDPNIFFELSQANTRGHSLKLLKPGCRLDIRNSHLHIVLLICGIFRVRELLHATHLTGLRIK